MYIPKYFKTHELVGPTLYAKYNGAPILWLAIDERVLKTLDALREEYGPMIVNNWKTGGPRKESGLREMDSKTGAQLSQHKFGRAADVLFTKVSAEEVRQEMKALKLFDSDERLGTQSKRKQAFFFINCVEWYQDGKPISWFHFDVRNDRAETGGIRIVNV